MKSERRKCHTGLMSWVNTKLYATVRCVWLFWGRQVPFAHDLITVNTFDSCV